MRYGFCTDLATKTRDAVEYGLLERIQEAGFDFVEFPLQMLEALSPEAFGELEQKLPELGLGCDVVCNFFPKRVRLTGPEADGHTVQEYLERAFPRAAALGVKKIVFGSCPARNLPEGVSEEEGYRQIKEVLQRYVIPRCHTYGITVVMEPIRPGSCNFIITLEDGMRVVKEAGSPRVMLLADLMHMSYSAEPAERLEEYLPFLQHVHLCEQDRILPEDGYSPYLAKCLERLAKAGYDKTVSFESKDASRPDGMKRALTLLKSRFEG